MSPRSPFSWRGGELAAALFLAAANSAAADPLDAQLDACYAQLEAAPPPTPPGPVPAPRPPRWQRLPQGNVPEILDDLDPASALESARRTAAYWDSSARKPIAVDGRSVEPLAMRVGFAELTRFLAGRPDGAALRAFLASRFDVVQSLPDDAARGEEGLVTGYCTPVIAVSREPAGGLVGVLALPPAGREKLARRDILAGGLDGLGLELGWAGLPELMFAQTEGSAWADLGSERRLLSYAGKNGKKWRGLSKALADCRIDLRSRPGCSAAGGYQGLRACMAGLPLETQGRMAALDPSYVYFSWGTGGPMGSGGLELTAGRSIAVDMSIVPLGLPALLRARKPSADRDFTRLVFTHDVGGAIKGGARVDLYAGDGEPEECHSMKSPGRLYLLIPRGRH